MRLYSAVEQAIITALKWIAVVFLAGFIGYFGKFLGKIVIAKIRHSFDLQKTENNFSAKNFGKMEENELKAGKPGEKDEKNESLKYEYKLQKEKLKLEKKRLKLEKKKIDD